MDPASALVHCGCLVPGAWCLLTKDTGDVRQSISAAYYRNTQLAARITCFLVFLQERLG